MSLKENPKKKEITMQSPIRIGLIGKQRSGKSTVAKYLGEAYDFFNQPLAGPIYDIAEKYFNMETKNRKLLIDIGEAMRRIDKDVWLKYMWRHINFIDKLVVPDVRMVNEFVFLKDKNFILIKIKSKREKRKSRDGYNLEAEASNTEKDVNFIPCDFKIYNNGSKKYLRAQIKRLMENKILP
jgi:cytidylate kinase